MIKYPFPEESIRINNLPFCVQHAKLSEDFEVHIHSFSELVIIMEGTATHIIDNEEYAIKAGDVYVIGGEISHGFKDVKSLSLYNIMYDSDTLYSYGGGIRSLPGFQALFVLEPQCRKGCGFTYRLQLSPSRQQYTRELLEIMFREFNGMLVGCEAVLQTYFMALVAYLSREYTIGKDFDNQTSGLMDLANAVAYMESHYMEPVSLKLLSGFLSVSARHFIRIFRKNYHATPIDYILRLRLDFSLALLKDRQWSITQVAEKCGFADSNYFSRQFRKRYGLSPSSYRNHDAS